MPLSPVPAFGSDEPEVGIEAEVGALVGVDSSSTEVVRGVSVLSVVKVVATDSSWFKVALKVVGPLPFVKDFFIVLKVSANSVDDSFSSFFSPMS